MATDMKHHCDCHSRADRGCRECWSILQGNLDVYFCQTEQAEMEAKDLRDRLDDAGKRLEELLSWAKSCGVYLPSRFCRPLGECGGDAAAVMMCPPSRSAMGDEALDRDPWEPFRRWFDPFAPIMEELRKFNDRWIDHPLAPVRKRRRRVAKKIEAREGKLRFAGRRRRLPRVL